MDVYDDDETKIVPVITSQYKWRKRNEDWGVYILHIPIPVAYTATFTHEKFLR